jgi:hypothetical protein
VLEDGFLGPFVALKWLNIAMKCTFTFALTNSNSVLFELSSIVGIGADGRTSMCSHVHTFTQLNYLSSIVLFGAS